MPLYQLLTIYSTYHSILCTIYLYENWYFCGNVPSILTSQVQLDLMNVKSTYIHPRREVSILSRNLLQSSHSMTGLKRVCYIKVGTKTWNSLLFLSSTISGDVFVETKSERQSFSVRLKLFDRNELKSGTFMRQHQQKFGDVEDCIITQQHWTQIWAIILISRYVYNSYPLW